MHSPWLRSDEHQVYVRAIRPSGGRDRAWRYLVCDRSGAVLVEGRFTDRPHGGTVQMPDRPEETVLAVQARPGFWWHGRYDVTQPGSEARLGAVSRSGQIQDSQGRLLGRVRNAERPKRKFFQSLLVGLLGAASGDGGATTLSASRMQIEVAGETVARMFRVALPFEIESGAVNPGGGDKTTPTPNTPGCGASVTNGWLLDLPVAAGDRLDARLCLAAAVLHIHLLNRWGN